MEQEEIILLLIIAICVIILFVFIVGLLKFRSNIILQEEEIEKLKSNIRLIKAKYVQTIKKGTKEVKEFSRNDARIMNNTSTTFAGFVRGQGVSLDVNESHAQAIGMIEKLAQQYITIQQKLNEAIEKYNVYISKTINLIYTGIFKRKKMKYIDQDNLKKSLELSEIDDFGI